VVSAAASAASAAAVVVAVAAVRHGDARGTGARQCAQGSVKET